jgi:hypothetical protein
MSVNDVLAEVLNINPPRGVLIAVVDESGPAKLAEFKMEMSSLNLTVTTLMKRTICCIWCAI